MDVDAEVVRRDALAMKRVDATHLAEKVPRSFGVELVLRERLHARQQLEPAFVSLHHERVFHAADRTVTHGEFRKVGFNLKAHGAAVAATSEFLYNIFTHGLNHEISR